MQSISLRSVEPVEDEDETFRLRPLSRGRVQTWTAHGDACHSRLPMSVVDRQLQHRSADEQNLSRPVRAGMYRTTAARDCQYPYLIADEFLDGDPWDECEDVAVEGLNEWHADFLRARTKNIHRIYDDTLENDEDDADEAYLGRCCSGECHLGVAAPTRSRCSASSTEISCCMETDGESTRTTVSTAYRNGCRSEVSTGSISSCCTDSQLHVTSPDDGEHDWELEFMLRAGMDADSIVDHVIARPLPTEAAPVNSRTRC